MLAVLIVLAISAAAGSDPASSEPATEILDAADPEAGGAGVERDGVAEIEPPIAEEEARLPLLLDIDLNLGFAAREGEPETAFYSNDDGTWAVEDILQPRDRRLYGSGALHIGAEVEVASWLLLTGLFDSGELRPGQWLDPPLDGLTSDGRSFEEAARANAFIRTLSAVFFLGPTVLEVGRRRTTLAGGLVYDDYGTGLAFTLNFDDLGLGPWRLEAIGLLVGETVDAFINPNPLFVLRVGYDLSLFESVSLFGALFWDRGTVYDVLASAVAERWITEGPPEGLCVAMERAVLPRELWPVSCLDVALDGLVYGEHTSTGTLGYVGLSGNLLPADGLSLRGDFALAIGRVSVDVSLDSYSLATLTGSENLADVMAFDGSFGLLGWAAQLEAHYGLGRHFDTFVTNDIELDIGAFAFGISGARPPTADGTYDAFIGVAPYWVWTGLFFSGGLSQSLNAGRTTAAGINGHGVFGGGPSAELGCEVGYIEARAAYLGAMKPRPGAGLTYGFELDVIGGLEITRWARFEAELDLFWPGGFFPQQQTAYRVIAWLNVGYAN